MSEITNERAIARVRAWIERFVVDLNLCPFAGSVVSSDALRIVAKGINSVAPQAGCLIITHYQRLLDHVQPHFVHVMIDGIIAQTGGPELALKLEKEVYEWLEAATEA